MLKRFSKQKIGRYFDTTLPFYWLYHTNSNGLHLGFSDHKKGSVSNAILNTNRFLARTCKIKPYDHILDAGCGIGGSSIWLAENYEKVHITGINISKNQINKARKLAQNRKVSTNTTFKVMDYMKTTFKSNAFDVVWALESVCYAPNKKYFLTEAFRLLKPGGKLIVSDGFLYRLPQTSSEKKVIKTFFKGYHLNDLSTFDEFKSYIIDADFKNIRFYNKTKAVHASVKRAYLLGKLGYPIAYIGWRLGILSRVIVDNALTAVAQRQGLEMKLGGYGVFYAEK